MAHKGDKAKTTNATRIYRSAGPGDKGIQATGLETGRPLLQGTQGENQSRGKHRQGEVHTTNTSAR